MKSHHAAALALVGWYLMSPPMRCEGWTLWGNGCLDARSDTAMDIEAPLAKWHVVSPFEKLADCQAERSREIKATHVGARIASTNLLPLRDGARREF